MKLIIFLTIILFPKIILAEIGERDFVLDLNEAEWEEKKIELQDLMDISCYLSGEK